MSRAPATRPPGLAAALLLLALGAGCQPSQLDAAPRNLLLISIDTLAPSHMSLYGAERRTSTLSRWAACASTTPSHRRRGPFPHTPPF